MNEIKVPVEWLEELVQLSDRIHYDNPKEVSNYLPMLQGYISSAKALIKYNKI